MLIDQRCQSMAENAARIRPHRIDALLEHHRRAVAARRGSLEEHSASLMNHRVPVSWSADATLLANITDVSISAQMVFADCLCTVRGGVVRDHVSGHQSRDVNWLPLLGSTFSGSKPVRGRGSATFSKSVTPRTWRIVQSPGSAGRAAPGGRRGNASGSGCRGATGSASSTRCSRPSRKLPHLHPPNLEDDAENPAIPACELG